MAIEFDAAVNGNFSSGTSLTWSHTCTGSDRILFVFATIESADDLVTGVTYNGVAMTQAATVANGAGNQRGYLYYLINPATGAHDVVVSSSPGVAIVGLSSSYTGAKQTGQPDSINTGSTGNFNTSLVVATTVVETDCWLVGGFSATVGGIAGKVGTTERATQGPGYRTITDSNTTVATGSQSQGIDCNSSSILGITGSIAPVAGEPPPPSTAKNLMLLGVG